jgi:4-hydroxy-2-oxoheptanedioate aldolase
MDLPVNTFKRAITSGKTQIGLWSTLTSHYASEIVAGAGYDWMLIDTEHSPSDLENVLRQLQAIAGYPATHAVARVPWNDMVTIKRFLDIGTQTLLIPYIQTAEEAKAAVSYTRYPPAGVRGVSAATRATRFARVQGYAKRAHEEICVLLQIETELGLKNLESIAAVEGVDGVFVGPGDLHASFGYVGETANPKIKPLIDDAIVRIRKAGKAPGILTGVVADAKHWLSLGAQFVAVGNDSVILARESEKLLAQFRG